MSRDDKMTLAELAAELGFPPEVAVDVNRQIDQYIADYEQKFHEFWNDTHANPHAAHEFNPALHPRDQIGRWGHGGGVHTLIKTKFLRNEGASPSFRADVEAAIDELPHWAAEHIARVNARSPHGRAGAGMITLVRGFQEEGLAGEFDFGMGLQITEHLRDRGIVQRRTMPQIQDTLFHELGHSVDMVGIVGQPFALSNSTAFKAAFRADKGTSGRSKSYPFSNPAELAAQLIGSFMGMDDDANDFRSAAPRAAKLTKEFLRAHFGYGEMHKPTPAKGRTLRDRIAKHSSEVCAERDGDDLILRWGVITEMSAKDYERRLAKGEGAFGKTFSQWAELVG